MERQRCEGENTEGVKFTPEMDFALQTMINQIVSFDNLDQDMIMKRLLDWMNNDRPFGKRYYFAGDEQSIPPIKITQDLTDKFAKRLAKEARWKFFTAFKAGWEVAGSLSGLFNVKRDSDLRHELSSRYADEMCARNFSYLDNDE